MMSQSRCTLRVRGLDCPNEVEVLRAALAEIERGRAPAMARPQGRPSFDGLRAAE